VFLCVHPWLKITFYGIVPAEENGTPVSALGGSILAAAISVMG